MAFEKGKSGNPTGRPKIVKEIQELARQHSDAAFKRILELSESEDPKVALAASKEILDRAWGKPAQAVELSGKDGQPLQAVINIAKSAN